MQKRIAIYWDFENVRIPHQVACLLAFAQSFGSIVTQRVYAHWRREVTVSEVVLDQHGFERVAIQAEGRNSADAVLKADCLSALQSDTPPDVVILLTSDKGFTGLAQVLHSAGTYVIVIGREYVTSLRLAQTTSEFHYAETLCRWLPLSPSRTKPECRASGQSAWLDILTVHQLSLSTLSALTLN